MLAHLQEATDIAERHFSIRTAKLNLKPKYHKM